jgi:hypothetical protein
MNASLLRRLAALEAAHLPKPPESEADREARIARIMAESDLIHARLRASPDWKEPTEAELAASRAEFDAFMATL